MGPSANLYALLVGVAAFAGWTLSRSAMPRRGWVQWLGGVGILALFFSIISPDDDLFQHELIRPATPAVGLSAHPRLAPRRSLAVLSINAFVAAGHPTRVLRARHPLVTDQPVEHDTDVHSPLSIHSPPFAS